MPDSTDRAWVLRSFGGLPQLEERRQPTPTDGSTLIRVLAAQVSHLDLDVVSGEFGVLPDLPCVPGTEAAGEVLASATLPVGSLVRVRGAGIGLRRNGGWAEHLLAPNSAVRRVPDDVDAATACTFFSPTCTAHAAVHDVLAVQPSERLLVTGAAGAVGGVAVQLALRAGADVIGVVGRESKRQHVPGGVPVVLAEELSLESVGGPVRAMVDTVGGDCLRQALSVVAPAGRAALVGYAAGRDLSFDLADFMLAEVSLLPVNLLRRGPAMQGVADRLLGDLQSGVLRLPVQRHGLGQLHHAIAQLRSGDAVGKVALVLE